MKLHKVEITMTAVALVRTDSADEAVSKAQEIKGRIMVLDPSQEMVFAGSLSSSKRPELSVSPTVTVIGVEGEATLVHKG